MCKRFVAILACLALGVYAAPYDLADEAQAQLDDLRAIVFGNIQSAQDSFAHYHSDTNAYSHNVVNLADLDIEQQWSTVEGEINQVKDLANTAGIDISSCTATREQVLVLLRDAAIQSIDECVSNYVQEASGILDGGFYMVDATMTKVNNLQDQLGRCAGNLLCISPLLTEIELDKIALPQNIRTYVNQAGDSLTTLKVLIGQCRNDNVAAYAGTASAVLADVVQCANQVLG